MYFCNKTEVKTFIIYCLHRNKTIRSPRLITKPQPCRYRMSGNKRVMILWTRSPRLRQGALTAPFNVLCRRYRPAALVGICKASAAGLVAGKAIYRCQGRYIIHCRPLASRRRCSARLLTAAVRWHLRWSMNILIMFWNADFREGQSAISDDQYDILCTQSSSWG